MDSKILKTRLSRILTDQLLVAIFMDKGWRAPLQNLCDWYFLGHIRLANSREISNAASSGSWNFRNVHFSFIGEATQSPLSARVSHMFATKIGPSLAEVKVAGVECFQRPFQEIIEDCLTPELMERLNEWGLTLKVGVRPDESEVAGIDFNYIYDERVIMTVKFSAWSGVIDADGSFNLALRDPCQVTAFLIARIEECMDRISSPPFSAPCAARA